MDFGALLEEYRRSAALSQGALARRAGIDPAYVNQMVHGRKIPSRAITISLAGACGLDAYETDRLLYEAGHAPVHDWQSIALDYARRFRLIDAAFIGAPELPARNPSEEASA